MLLLSFTCGVHTNVRVLRLYFLVNLYWDDKFSDSHSHFTSNSICATGYREQGEFLLSKFKWGHSFVEQNGHLLDLYLACTTAEEVQKVQEEHLKQLQYDHEHRQDKGGLVFVCVCMHVFVYMCLCDVHNWCVCLYLLYTSTDVMCVCCMYFISILCSHDHVCLWWECVGLVCVYMCAHVSVCWAIQWSWFARVNALCNLSRKKSQALPGRFWSRRCFTLCITVDFEPRITKQYKCQDCCSCKKYCGKVMEGGKKVSASFFGWPEDREFVEKMHFGASYSMSNTLLLISKCIMTTGLKKCL